MVGLAVVILADHSVHGPHGAGRAARRRARRRPSPDCHRRPDPERISSSSRDDEARLRQLAERSRPPADGARPATATGAARRPRRRSDRRRTAAARVSESVRRQRRVQSTAERTAARTASERAHRRRAPALARDMSSQNSPRCSALAQVSVAPTQPRRRPPPAAAPRRRPRRPRRPIASERRADENPAAGDRGLRLLEGTVIETVLINRLDGTFAGPVACLVTTPVYSHDRQTRV